jgi:hypothetical protein
MVITIPKSDDEPDLTTLADAYGIQDLHTHIKRQLLTKRGRLRTNRDFQEKYYVSETDEPEGAIRGLFALRTVEPFEVTS